MCRNGVLIFQGVERHRWWQGIGHFHEARNAAGHGRARLGPDTCLVGQTGLAKMHLVVDHSGQEMCAGSIQHAGAGASTDRIVDLCDTSIVDEQVAIRNLPFIHQPGIFNQQFASHLRNRVISAFTQWMATGYPLDGQPAPAQSAVFANDLGSIL